jgi:F-type H+-transporting ATPase subunit a
MGEHGTWFDYLNRFEWWRSFSHSAEDVLGRKRPLMLVFQDSHFTLTHVLLALIVLLLVTAGAMAFFRSTKRGDGGIVPPRTMNVRHVFEYLTESAYGMTQSTLGPEHADRFFPLIGALWFFLLFSNLLGLVPGLEPATDTLKTNIGLAVMVFLLTHIIGFREHGIGYLKHFLGPVWWLAPLMLPIELIGHVARIISLSMRLLGNMFADHKVVFTFFTLVPVLVPVPFMLLGVLVCVVQAFVFVTLTMVYLGMALEHEH